MTRSYEGKGQAEALPYPRPSQRPGGLVAGAVVHITLTPIEHFVTHDGIVARSYEGKGQAETLPYPRPSQRPGGLVAGAVVHGINSLIVAPSPITIVIISAILGSTVAPIPARDTQLRG